MSHLDIPIHSSHTQEQIHNWVDSGLNRIKFNIFSRTCLTWIVSKSDLFGKEI